MRRLLVLLLLVVAVVVGVGFYLDWFHVSTGGTKDAGPMNVGVTIDKDKMKADAEAAKEKAKGLTPHVGGTVTTPAAAGTPGR